MTIMRLKLLRLIINTNDIFRKASDENFEKLINEI